jgi:hypothetical protein
LCNTVAWGQGWLKNNSKNKNQNFDEIIFQEKVFLHGQKENFEENFIILEYAELSFSILNNYSAKKNRPCPPATVNARGGHLLYP